MANKWVYLFSEGNANMRELLGGKGANLAEMTSLGLPVPQGFTITTEACTQYYEDGREINEEIQGQINEYIGKMEEITGKKFGDKIVARGQDGAITEDAKAYYICPSVPLWRDHFVDTSVRVQRETGAKILYIDVFAFYRGHSCFAKDHGHEVPSVISRAVSAPVRSSSVLMAMVEPCRKR